MLVTLILVCLLPLASASQAETVELWLSPVADAFVWEAHPTIEYGCTHSESDFLFVGEASGEFWTYIQWEIPSNLPQDNITVVEAKVRLRQWCSNDTGSNFTGFLNRMREPWNECSINWSNRATLRELLGSITYDGCTNGWQYFEFGGAALESYVEDVMNDVETDYGILLQGGPSGKYVRYWSREAGSAYEPKLYIKYEIPDQTPPDLEIVDLWTVPSSPVAGESADLYVKVRNAGGVAVSDANIHYLIDGEEVSEDLHDIAPGETITAHDPYTFETCGSFEYGVCVDAAPGETDTSDNCDDMVVVAECLSLSLSVFEHDGGAIDGDELNSLELYKDDLLVETVDPDGHDYTFDVESGHTYEVHAYVNDMLVGYYGPSHITQNIDDQINVVDRVRIDALVYEMNGVTPLNGAIVELCSHEDRVWRIGAVAANADVLWNGPSGGTTDDAHVMPAMVDSVEYWVLKIYVAGDVVWQSDPLNSDFTGMEPGGLIELTINTPAGPSLPDGKWTIITHGWVPNDTGYQDVLDAWMQPLADRISNLDPGNVIVHTMDRNTFGLSNGGSVDDDSVHHVLLFDWTETSKIDSWDSTLTPYGYAFAAGDSLYALLRHWGIEHDVLMLMGYSRGAVVMSETVRRLNLIGADPEQVIFLDGEGAWDGIYEDNRFDAWESSPTGDTQWDNIYSTWDEPLIPLGGHPKPACRNLDVHEDYSHSGKFPNEPPSITSLPVNYLFFDGTHYDLPVDLLGYEWTPSSGDPLDLYSEDYFPYDDEPFNAHFEWKSFAGWFGHGGSGTGVIDSSVYPYNNYLELRDDHAYQETNWFVWPADHSYVRFRYLVDEEDDSDGDDELWIWLYRVDGTSSSIPVASLTHETDWVTRELLIDDDFPAHVVQIGFELRGGAQTYATVRIDEVECVAGLPQEIRITVDGADVSMGSVIDVGTTDQGTPLGRDFVIHNDGGQALSIGNIADPIGFHIDPQPAPSVPPFGATLFTVWINENQAGPHGPSDVTVPNDDANGDESPFVFQVRGDVQSSSLVITPDHLDFGPVAVDDSHALVCSLENAGTSPLQLHEWSVQSVQVYNAGHWQDVNPGTRIYQLSPENPVGGDDVLHPGESTELTITFTPEFTNMYRGEVLIMSSDPDGPHLVELEGEGIGAAVAEFDASPRQGAAPLAVSFGDLSSGATSWEWDFENDGVWDSDEQNPVHLYETTGQYSVRLRINGPTGDEELKQDFIDVCAAPNADFLAYPREGDAPLEVTFTDSSSGGTSWSWDFDSDGTVDSTDRDPVHVYESGGLYTVTLTVNGPCGTDIEVKDDFIEVFGPDGPTITGYEWICPELHIYFSADMDPASFNSHDDFRIINGAGERVGEFDEITWPQPDHLVWTTDPLPPDGSYKAILGGSAADIDGNLLGSDLVDFDIECDAVLTGIEIIGPVEVPENSQTDYDCHATYSIGDDTLDVDPTWSVTLPATIDSDGNLTAPEVDEDTTVTITAEYTENGVTEIDTHEVLIVDQPDDRLYVVAGAVGGDGSTWSSPLGELQDALAIAIAGTEIWVAAGTYTPDPGGTDRERSFDLVEGVAIFGHFGGFETSIDERDLGNPDHVTVLTGDLLGDDGPDFTNYDDNSRHIVTATTEITSATVLDGFTIEAGGASGESTNPWTSGGSGVICDGADLVVRNCIFHRNRTGRTGGAFYSRTGAPSVFNCRFEFNQGGFGAAVNTYSGVPLARHCTFIGNHSYMWGGAIANESVLRVEGCLFIANTAELGAGAISAGGEVTVVNSTFGYNHSPWGGAIHLPNEPHPVTIDNSIFWGNSDDSSGYEQDAQFRGYTSRVTINFSCVQGWTGSLGGAGNIGAHPNYIDELGPDGVAETGDENLRLCCESPCIDAAANASVPDELNFDLDGWNRFVDDPNTTDTGTGAPPVVDMGAFEFHNLCPGDLNGDGLVDISDLGILLASFGLEPGDPAYNPDADINCDGSIDIADLGTLLAEFNISCP